MTRNNIYVYIDGHNLYKGVKTASPPWEIDFNKLSQYLKRKFFPKQMFYYLGVREKKYTSLYRNLREYGFTLKFRIHNPLQISQKKGNVDVDIIFDILTSFYEEPNSKFVLVTQDGDYIRLVRKLKEANRLIRLIFPNKTKALSLYRHLPTSLWLDLSHPSLRKILAK